MELHTQSHREHVAARIRGVADRIARGDVDVAREAALLRVEAAVLEGALDPVPAGDLPAGLAHERDRIAAAAAGRAA